MPMIATEPKDDAALALVAVSSIGGEALRYFIASLAALAIDAGLLWVGVSAVGLPAWVAGTCAYSAGLVFIYVLAIHWVFADRTVRDSRSEFVVFAVLGVIGLILNSATLYIATGLGLALPLAKMLSAAIGFGANFVSRKWLLFSKQTMS